MKLLSFKVPFKTEIIDIQQGVFDTFFQSYTTHLFTLSPKKCQLLGSFAVRLLSKDILLEDLIKDFYDHNNILHIEGEQEIYLRKPWSKKSTRRILDYLESCRNGVDDYDILKNTKLIESPQRTQITDAKIFVDNKPKYSIYVRQGLLIYHYSYDLNIITENEKVLATQD